MLRHEASGYGMREHFLAAAEAVMDHVTGESGDSRFSAYVEGLVGAIGKC